MGLTYVSIDTPDALLHVPNAGMLAAAVGPAQAGGQAGEQVRRQRHGVI